MQSSAGWNSEELLLSLSGALDVTCRRYSPLVSSSLVASTPAKGLQIPAEIPTALLQNPQFLCAPWNPHMMKQMICGTSCSQCSLFGPISWFLPRAGISWE